MFAVVIGILLIVAAIALPFITHSMGYRGGGISSAVCLVLAAVIVGISCISTVPTGHTGILSTFGRVEEKSLPNGMNIHAPWQDITTMSNKEQKNTNNGVCFSKDSQEVTYIYTTKHSLLPSATPNIYKTVGLDYYDILLKKQIENTIAIEFGLVEAENMTALFAQLQASVNKSVKAYAEGYGIIIDVVIDDFDFTDAYTNANADAEAARIKAQADYEVAQLEADAIAYKGQKEAEATAALAAAITDEVVAYEYAQNWSGELPQYMMGGTGALPIIDIPMNTEEE